MKNKYFNCMIICGSLLLLSLIEIIIFACVRQKNYGIIDMQLYSGIVLAIIAVSTIVLAALKRKIKAHYYDFIVLFVAFALWLGTFIQQTLNGRGWANPNIIYEKFISNYNGFYYHFICVKYNRLIPTQILDTTSGNIYSFTLIISVILMVLFTVLFFNYRKKRMNLENLLD